MLPVLVWSKVKEKHTDKLQSDYQVSISPTFYKQLLRHYSLDKKLQIQTVSREKSCAKDFCTTKVLVKCCICWRYWQQGGFEIKFSKVCFFEVNQALTEPAFRKTGFWKFGLILMWFSKHWKKSWREEIKINWHYTLNLDEGGRKL